MAREPPAAFGLALPGFAASVGVSGRGLTQQGCALGWCWKAACRPRSRSPSCRTGGRSWSSRSRSAQADPYRQRAPAPRATGPRRAAPTEPLLVVEVDTDMCFDHQRGRHPTALTNKRRRMKIGFGYTASWRHHGPAGVRAPHQTPVAFRRAVARRRHGLGVTQRIDRRHHRRSRRRRRRRVAVVSSRCCGFRARRRPGCRQRFRPTPSGRRPRE